MIKSIVILDENLCSARETLSGRLILYTNNRVCFVEDASKDEYQIENAELLIEFLFMNFPPSFGGSYICNLKANLYGSVSGNFQLMVSKVTVIHDFVVG